MTYTFDIDLVEIDKERKRYINFSSLPEDL